MSEPIAVLCTVPRKKCSGSERSQTADHVPNFSTKQKEVPKAHDTPEEAFNCMSSYLTGVKGYERVGSREFLDPEGGILVLTGKTKFGVPLRKGKEGRLMLEQHPEIVVI